MRYFSEFSWFLNITYCTMSTWVSKEHKVIITSHEWIKKGLVALLYIKYTIINKSRHTQKCGEDNISLYNIIYLGFILSLYSFTTCKYLPVFLLTDLDRNKWSLFDTSLQIEKCGIFEKKNRGNRITIMYNLSLKQCHCLYIDCLNILYSR